MTDTNPFKKLLPSIHSKPSLVPADAFSGSSQKMDQEAINLFRKAGATAQMIQKSIEADVSVLYDRVNLAAECERAVEHWFVGPAVALYADVASTFSPIHNATVWVTSDSETIQTQLNDFLDRIGIEEKIHDWAYTLSLYGDLFVRMNGVPGLGVVSVDDGEHPISISRIEYEGVLLGFYKTPQGQMSSTADGKMAIIPPWDWVHFRILGAKKKRGRSGDQTQGEFRQIQLITGSETRQATSRYGTSIITNAIPSYKRLRLAEDSLLLARLTRGIIRYIWKCKIDMSNQEAASSLIEQYAELITRARAIDTGDSPVFDSKNSPMCLSGDTNITLCNSKVVPIREMAENPSLYEGLSVWTVNPETHNLEAKKILKACKTRLNAQLVRVYLDNNEFIDCTPDHKFMLRDGSFSEAQYLQPNQSLMPFYQKICEVENGPSGYDAIYDPGTDGYRYAHKLVTGSIPRGFVVHHLDFNKRNNDPSNLVVCTNADHRNIYHKKHTPETIEKIKKNQVAWLKGKTKENCPELVELAQKHSEYLLEFYQTEKGKAAAKKAGETKRRRYASGEIKPNSPWTGKTWEEMFGVEGAERQRQLTGAANRKRTGAKHTEESRKLISQNRKGKGTGLRVVHAYRTKFCACGCGEQFREDYRNPHQFVHGHNKGNARKPVVTNHKVLRVEWLVKREDTYDITVEDNHNFAVTAGVFIHNSVVEDLFVPVWGDVGDLTQEKIGGEVDIRWIVDVDNLRQQLAFALACPLSLGGAYVKEASGSLGSEAISKLDIRFARSARRLQRALVCGISRMCQIHLAYMGMDPDPNLFQVHMAETSSAEEESLRKSLESGMKTFQSFLTTLKKVAGKKLDVGRVFEYFNEKVLKLEDFRIEDFYKPADVLSKEAEAIKAKLASQQAVPGGEGLQTPPTTPGTPPEPSPTPSTVRLKPESVDVPPWRKRIFERKPIFNLDMLACVPVVIDKESTPLLEGVQERYSFIDKTKITDSRELWCRERDYLTWKKIVPPGAVVAEKVLTENINSPPEKNN